MPGSKKRCERLAADKAPATIAQLVMWKLIAGKLEWETDRQELSKKSANAHELSLGAGICGPSSTACRKASRGRLLCDDAVAPMKRSLGSRRLIWPSG